MTPSSRLKRKAPVYGGFFHARKMEGGYEIPRHGDRGSEIQAAGRGVSKIPGAWIGVLKTREPGTKSMNAGVYRFR